MKLPFLHFILFPTFSTFWFYVEKETVKKLLICFFWGVRKHSKGRNIENTEKKDLMGKESDKPYWGKIQNNEERNCGREVKNEWKIAIYSFLIKWVTLYWPLGEKKNSPPATDIAHVSMSTDKSFQRSTISNFTLNRCRCQAEAEV